MHITKQSPIFDYQFKTKTRKVMKTTNKVSDLVAEYQADPNCWPSLWIDDLLKTGEVTKEERNQFMLNVLINTWQRAFSSNAYTDASRRERLRELLTWDKPRNGNEIEHTAKVTALQHILKD